MGDLPLSTVRKIRRFEAIETEGLTLYPIAVDEFEAFSHARAAIEFLQQSLPVALLSKPLLQAYYTLELEAAAKGAESVGQLYEAIVFLLLALRAGEDEEKEKRLERAQIVPRAEDATRLERITFRLDGGKTVSVTPIQFQRLRPILAAQNGIELLSDSANPDLVQAERDLAEMNAPDLDMKLEAMVAAVATVSGADEAEIYRWPILRLMLRKDALQRALGYLACSMTSAAGGKWKGGNPIPNPIFARVNDHGGGVVDMQSFAGGAGVRAMQNAGSRVT